MDHGTTVGVLAGPALYWGGEYSGGQGVEATAFLRVGDVHGFVLGLRPGVFLLSPAQPAIYPPPPYVRIVETQIALDLGYSTRFEIAGGNAGFFFLAGPTGSVYGSKSLALLGFTAGVRLQVGSVFELHIPVRYFTAFDASNTRYQASLLAGASF